MKKEVAEILDYFNGGAVCVTDPDSSDFLSVGQVLDALEDVDVLRRLDSDQSDVEAAYDYLRSFSPDSAYADALRVAGIKPEEIRY